MFTADLFPENVVTVDYETFNELWRLARLQAAGLLSEYEYAEEAIRLCPDLKRYHLNRLEVR